MDKTLQPIVELLEKECGAVPSSLCGDFGLVITPGSIVDHLVEREIVNGR